MESAATVDAFGAFANLVYVNGESTRAIIDLAVDVIDDDGNVRRAAGVAHFLKSELPTWSAGALLETDGANYRMREVIADDGYIVKVEISPTS